MPSPLWKPRAAPTARTRHNAGVARPTVVAGLAVVALLAAGCSGKKAADPAAVAREAKTTLDAATTVRIQLTSKGAPTTLRTATGEIKRPDGFVGTIGATVLGLQVDVPVVSLGGHFLAKLPRLRRIRPSTRRRSVSPIRPPCSTRPPDSRPSSRTRPAWWPASRPGSAARSPRRSAANSMRLRSRRYCR